VRPDVIPTIHCPLWSRAIDDSVMNETSAAVNDSSVIHDNEVPFDPDLDFIVPTDDDELEEKQYVVDERGGYVEEREEEKEEEDDDDDDDDDYFCETEIM